MDKEWLNECISKFDGFRNYDYGDVKILISNTESNFEKGLHQHAEYEFMSVRCKDVTTICNGNRIVMKKGYIMPFNSYDIHGQEHSVTMNSFICMIFCEKLIKRVALEAFGFEKQPLFINQSFLPNSNFNFYLATLIDQCFDKENQYCQDLLIQLIIIELFKSSENNVITNHLKPVHSIFRAKKYLDENLELDFDLEKIAKISGMNKYHFLKRFKEEMHLTPLQYLMGLKIDKAKILISLHQKSLTEIAFELGFSSQSHFITQFKKSTGITPGKYRKTLL